MANSGAVFLDLPDDCIEKIFEKLYLEPHKLCKLMTVCKRFYDVCSSPRLWRIADFRFERYLRIRKLKRMDIVKRREIFAQFLTQRRARLTHLGLFCDIYSEFQAVSDLVLQCCSKELKYVEIKWSPSWLDDDEERRIESLKYFIEVFEKLIANCPDIYFLKTQLDCTSKTARMVGSLSNIRHLELTFLGSQVEIEKTGSSAVQPIEIILFSLSKLKILKIKLSQALDDFEGYVFKSDSLKHLDYSKSTNLVIKEMCLPKLKTFMAVNVFNLSQGRISPCLFELIENGCPNITKINYRRSIIPGLENFPLTEEDKIEMNICNCGDHMLDQMFFDRL